jgi:hypothetical protein
LPVAATMGVVKLTVNGLELEVGDLHARTNARATESA